MPLSKSVLIQKFLSEDKFQAPHTSETSGIAWTALESSTP